jgi:uncharacterized protein YdhG (YjbR/CyaY superfamily)
MARPKFTSVDRYIASQPEASQPILERVRAVIRKALPKAEEVISYQIPAYKIDAGYVIYFAGFKQHYSLFPAKAPLVAAFQKELAPYEANKKGTIRFPLAQPVPVRLIARIAKFRLQEVRASAATSGIPPRTSTR